MGEEGDYIPIIMTPALRWAAMRAVLMFHQLQGTKSQDSVQKTQSLFEEKRNLAEAILLTSITPYRHIFHSPKHPRYMILEADQGSKVNC